MILPLCASRSRQAHNANRQGTRNRSLQDPRQSGKNDPNRLQLSQGIMPPEKSKPIYNVMKRSHVPRQTYHSSRALFHLISRKIVFDGMPLQSTMASWITSLYGRLGDWHYIG